MGRIFTRQNESIVKSIICGVVIIVIYLSMFFIFHLVSDTSIMINLLEENVYRLVEINNFELHRLEYEFMQTRNDLIDTKNELIVLNENLDSHAHARAEQNKAIVPDKLIIAKITPDIHTNISKEFEEYIKWRKQRKMKELGLDPETNGMKERGY